MSRPVSILRLVTSLLFGALILAGCSAKINYADLSFRDTDYPEVGVVVKADVGDRLIEQSYEVQYSGAVVTEDGSCPGSFWGVGPVYKKGQPFRKGTLGSKTVFCGMISIKNNVGTLFPREVCLSQDGSEWKVDGATCAGLKLTEKKITENNADNFQRTLLYKGKSGNQVFLDYREFKDDFARAAFTQELIFDLDQGNEIGFRGMRMRILAASNTGIEYVLEKKFED